MTITINSFTIDRTDRGEYPKEEKADTLVSFDASSDLAGVWTVEALLMFSPYGGGLGTFTTAVLAGMVVLSSSVAGSVLTGPGTYSDVINIPGSLLQDVGTYIVRLRVLPGPGYTGFSVLDSDPFFVVDVGQADINNTLNDTQKSNLDENQGEGGSGTGDKSFVVSFTNQTSQVVIHNLDKYPNVVFRDISGAEYEVSIVHNSVNQCTVSWNGNLSGTITCN